MPSPSHDRKEHASFQPRSKGRAGRTRLCRIKRLGDAAKDTWLLRSCDSMGNVVHKAQRKRSATAAGEPSLDEAKEHQISKGRRRQKGRRLLAGASWLANSLSLPLENIMILIQLAGACNLICRRLRGKTTDNPSFLAKPIEPPILVRITRNDGEVFVFPLAELVCGTTTGQEQKAGSKNKCNWSFHNRVVRGTLFRFRYTFDFIRGDRDGVGS